jgi:5-methylthioribose kinase
MADTAVSDHGYRQLDPAEVVRYARAFLPGAAEAQDAGAGNINCVLIGNLLISYLAHRAQGHDAFAATLWQTAEDFWEAFTTTLSALWPEEELWQDIFLNQAQDAAGRYAGTKLVRRIIGLAHAPDIDEIPDDAQRQRAQRDALSGGRALILAPRIDSLEDLWAVATTT